MLFRRFGALVLVFAAPALAADSVFVDGAFNGSWGASFPDFFGSTIIGPINFMQVDEAEAIPKMNEFGGEGAVEKLCPAAGEKREFYGGDYDYQKRGEVYACTNGETLIGLYRDYDLSDKGSILIDQTFPGDEPPRWAGAYTNIDDDTGAMRGVLQSGGIATPLARVGGATITHLNGASYFAKHGLAPEAFVAAFGSNLAAATEVGYDLPTTLGGVTVTITDSAGEMHAARIYVVSPKQINYLIPAGVAFGEAVVTVKRDNQIVAEDTVEIAAVSPGIFSAASNGEGVAAAVFLRVNPDGSRTDGVIFDGSLAPIPLDMGPEGSQLYIFLYCTGMRNHMGNVSVKVNGIEAPYSGPVDQMQFAGLDQLNVGPLPRSLIGGGEVDIEVMIDGKDANVVTAAFQ